MPPVESPAVARFSRLVGFISEIPVQYHFSSRLEIQGYNLIIAAHLAFGPGNASNSRGGKFSILPRHINFKAATRPQSSDIAVGPDFRQSWKQMNFAGMRLQKHLRNA